ncbi:2'-5' RNA ligase family protein [Paenibacillus xerothermodurans]|uniref:2'-5' RNA ligase family protein n=1 Tax=Paenibacillus xerothermodurans TaxID=1977292 RepID=A0A2W1NBS0_PAEXE|nr:2'-5' RNA ligase family protein [Paenibacillus xerothermodurans]PZE21100.1 2'-5' RNA ligase family protein [Paenibacillus xerothermodurans]
MHFFIGIVPPDEYVCQTTRFQRQWPNNALPQDVEPHITVKAQGGLTPDGSWIDAVKCVCSGFPAFQVSLHQPMFFSRDVLFLSVRSEKIHSLHERLVHAISPSTELIKRYFELESYSPHLTLGQTYWGLTHEELMQMLRKAEQELTPYPTFDVNFVRIYREIERDRYVKYVDVPLARSEKGCS